MDHREGRHRGRAAVHVVLLSLISACGGGADPAPPSAPTPTVPAGELVYVSERDGRPALHRVSPDGTGDRPVDVCPPGQDSYPGPADPRGEVLLVVCAAGDDEVSHVEALWQVPRAGGAPVQLVAPGRVVRNPTWSADGAWIAYESDVASFRDVYVVPRGGGATRRVTSVPEGAFEPAFAPVGDQLAWVSSGDGNAEVYTGGLDGVGVRRTDAPLDDGRPSWSPDGRTLAFLSMRDGVTRVWVLDVATGDSRPLLAPGPESHTDLVWSPDGSALAVTVAPTGAPADAEDVVSVWLVTPDGKVERRIAGAGPRGRTWFPAWSPDGRWLVFVVEDTSGADLVVEARDGTGRRRIAAPGLDWLPRWLPPAR